MKTQVKNFHVIPSNGRQYDFATSLQMYEWMAQHRPSYMKQLEQWEKEKAANSCRRR